MTPIDQVKELVERLREIECGSLAYPDVAERAADTIESLLAERDGLREALTHIASALVVGNPLARQLRDTAKAALNTGGTHG